MSRILLTSWGSFGDVYPYVGIALALKGRGHQPVLAMPEFYRAVVEGLGLEFHPVGPQIDPDQQLSITLLTNRTWPDCSNQAIKQLRPRFHDAVVEALGSR